LGKLVCRGRSNACNTLAPQIDKNLGNPRGEKGRSVRLRIIGGYEFYPLTECELFNICRNKKLVVVHGVAEKTVEGDSITGHHRRN
jgi:hypothetical protein